MRVAHKVLVNLTIVAIIIIAIYCFQVPSRYSRYGYNARNDTARVETLYRSRISSSSSLINGADQLGTNYERKSGIDANGRPIVADINESRFDDDDERRNLDTDVRNVWCIFTKVTSNSPMKRKFKIFTASLVKLSTVPLAFHVISDSISREIAQSLISDVVSSTRNFVRVRYYDAGVLATQLEDVVSSMSPHFSSNPGTYYSDALFFLSLGLHRIAPADQKRAVMFDADTKFRTDVKELFYEFDKFGPEALFGLAPELTPVYRHVLYLYRNKHPDTPFGEPAYLGGFPGFNSGMVLFDFEKLRRSLEYDQIVSRDSVAAMTEKYKFKGHLGDQDFYTILGMERPELIHKVDCGWNRQLCTWWRDHGYADVFANYSRCNERVKLWHGNCNTPIPDY